jgi:hypothetical protein
MFIPVIVHVIIVAADIPLSIGVPCFDLGDMDGISDLIEKRFLSRHNGESGKHA